MKAAKKLSTHKAASGKVKRSARGKAPARKASGRPAAKSKRTARKLDRERTAPMIRPPGSKRRIPVPAILLEGDTPGVPSPLPRSAAEKVAGARGGVEIPEMVLPEAYGTQRLKLTPRDPHWVHAHWDFTREQLRAVNARAADGHLVVRVFRQSEQPSLISETHVHPESVRWMVHVPQAGAAYAAEVGFYDKRGRWSSLAASGPVRTPPARVSADCSFEVATLKPNGEMHRHGTLSALKPPPGVPAIAGATTATAPSSAGAVPAGLADLAAAGPASLDLGSWSSAVVPGSLSSPAGAEPRSPFRLEIGAELVVFGATEPGAALRMGDRRIAVNPDGTFSLRLLLPEGAHHLSFTATAAGSGEQRGVALRIIRHTQRAGEVGVAEGPCELKTPAVENL